MGETVIEEETQNFEIKIQDPEIEKGEVKARIKAKPIGHEGQCYGEIKKIKGRTVSEYAGIIQDMFNMTDEEKKELKSGILSLKTDIRKEARKEQIDEDTEKMDLEQQMHEILHILATEDGEAVKLSNLEKDYPDASLIADEKSDYMYKMEGKLEITDEGRQELRNYLGYEAFEGDPEAEAIKQLENDPLKYILDSFDKVHKGDTLLKIWELCSALSCTCSDLQIHSWAVGPSGKGKSHIKRRLCDCYLPHEMFKRKNSLSPKALLYKADNDGTDFLDEQLVFFDEVDDLEEVVTLMRSITDQDEDRVEHQTVIDQNPETMILETSQITVWFTSVETIQDEQLKNRFILTNPDGSEELDEEVYDWMHERLHRGQKLDFMPKESPIIERMIRNIREETEDWIPIVPFEVEWKQKFNRRLYPYFYTLMGLIAKIHYKNREVVDGKIIVTKADFKLASLIWSRLIDTTVAQQDQDSIKLLKQLPESKLNAKNTTQLSKDLDGFSPNKVREKAMALEESAEELTLIQSEMSEGRWVYWAGPDIEKLVDNEPEIKKLDDETIKSFLEDAGLELDDGLVESVNEAKIPVYDELVEKHKESEKRRKRSGDSDEDEKISLTDQEKEALRQLEDYGWQIEITQLQHLLDNPADTITELEEKDLLYVDGDNIPRKKAKLEEARDEGVIEL